MILISGATGNNGREIVHRLVARGVRVRAMVRSIRHTHGLDHPLIELVEADFDDPGSLTMVLRDVDKAFLVTRSSEKAEEQQTNFVRCAIREGVRHIVKLSQFAASQGSPVRFLRYHAAIEELISSSGMDYTFLRPNLYMQGFLGFASMIKSTSRIYASAGDAAVSLVDVRNIADAAVAVLMEVGHSRATYTLTGPEALTHLQIASTIGAARGTAVEYLDVSPEQMLEILRAAEMPKWEAEGLVEDYQHYQRGEAAGVTNDVRRLIGKEPHSFAQFAIDYKDAFTV